MSIFELITIFETDRERPPESIDALLDFYQQKYIAGEIDILAYRKIYHYLHRQGAVSSHEFA
ncbi:YppF-like protein [Lentibacillus persicus]|uniref:YppF-like protein n=1 Tax=Lentibacillus persicus TaxID=640948 RepID=A0A1I1RU93_9BACI|nr:YppF family protein [Lentibacillus persicus]SFD37821.1 YppF-like protein [Lentibacillus persicus]